MLTDFATYVASEWKMISQAPASFGIAVLICAAVVWLFRRSVYTGQIDVLNERIKLRDDQLQNMERKLGADSPGDALIKIGELTAKIDALSLGKWDPLTEAQTKHITQAISVLPKSKIAIHLDSDAVALGVGVDRIFETLGWEIKGVRVVGGSYGLKIGPDCEEARVIGEAFRTAGFEIQIESLSESRPLRLYLGGNPRYLD